MVPTSFRADVLTRRDDFLAVQDGCRLDTVAVASAGATLSVGLIHDDGLEALQEECCEHDQSVRGGRWVDVALGGLNYQIEHHLFPTMPRMNLRRAQPLVRVFCNQRGIDYAQCGLLRSYGYVLAHLHHVGASLHAQPAWAV